MPTDQTTSNHEAESTTSPLTTARWWIQAIHVRLRFLLIVMLVGGVVSQWPLIRNIWDRWTWNPRHSHAGSVSSSHEYFCPMDAGVISVWPAICPICNMDLVPRKKADAPMLPEGVVARMQFSPYRIQLAGIRTVTIEHRPLKYEHSFTGRLQEGKDGSIGFIAIIPEFDTPLFVTSQPAEVRVRTNAATHRAIVRLAEGLSTNRIQFVLEDPEAAPSGTIATAVVSLPIGDAEGVLAVPESAVVDRGDEQLVYVESMPGMFDGVKVDLGRRCGAFYPVVNGLTSGQKVASSGAFLIDAESRLNPSLAAGYFGANQKGSQPTSTVPESPSARSLPRAKSKSPERTLSPEDLALVERQQICPVTELPLNSMGGPVPVVLTGRRVFICCSGCEQKLKDDPDKYLARLKVP